MGTSHSNPCNELASGNGAYRPDPDLEAIDAFTLNWENLNFYAFPPLSVIPTVLAKIQKEY